MASGIGSIERTKVARDTLTANLERLDEVLSQCQAATDRIQAILVGPCPETDMKQPGTQCIADQIVRATQRGEALQATLSAIVDRLG